MRRPGIGIYAAIIGGVCLGAIVPLGLTFVWWLGSGIGGVPVAGGYVLAAIQTVLTFLAALVLVRKTNALFAWIACDALAVGGAAANAPLAVAVSLLAAPLVFAIPAVYLILYAFRGTSDTEPPEWD